MVGTFAQTIQRRSTRAYAKKDLTLACRRPPIASAPASLRPLAAPEARRWAALWRHSGAEDQGHVGAKTGEAPWGPCLQHQVTEHVLPTRSTARDRSCCCCMGSAMTGASGPHTGGSCTSNRRLRSSPWIGGAVATAT